MQTKQIEIGAIVYSIAGRDSGKFFAVLEVVNDSFVKIADGELRRIEKPKLKKIKHLKVQAEEIPKISEKLKEGKKIFDAELKSALRFLNG
ncbi:MAG: KOW domain-containing RNA-binding protein [Firmicutes bacterium]|nr:KOW domain-containing RNA-binding protein [Bacillota bacterium]